MSDLILTIAIPTYNRPKQLIERLNEILPQLSSQLELLIIDNHSSESVVDYVSSSFDLSKYNVRFIRNNANIGAAGNVSRCYENALGKWVWTIGDDDSIEPDAIHTILSTINENAFKTSLGFSFSTGIHSFRSQSLVTGIDEFCEFMKDPIVFSNTLFISSCVVYRETFLEYLRFAYLYMSSAGPHLSVMIHALMNNHSLMIIPKMIIKWGIADPSEQWCKITVAKALPLLGEIGECHPSLISFQAGYIHHMPDHLLFLVGVNRIFSESDKSPLYWNVYYNRISPYLSGTAWIRSILLSLLASFAHRNTLLRKLGKLVCTLIPQNSSKDNGSIDRL